MKKLRISLTVLAVLLAGATVVAESLLVVTYYRASTPFGAKAPNCDIIVSTVPCVAGENQCLKDFTITINGIPVTQPYRISMRTDSGPCVVVPRP